jgi:WD40 repeat protein
LKLWDVATGRERVSLKWAEEPMLYSAALSFSPDGKQLAVGMSGGRVRLIEVATGKEGKPLAAALWKCQPLFSPDGKMLVTPTGGSSDGKERRSVKVWDPTTGTLLRTFEVTKGDIIRHVVFSPDSKTLAVGSNDKKGEIPLYDPTTGKRRATFQLSDAPGGMDVHHLAFSPDSKILAASGFEQKRRPDGWTRVLTKFFSLPDGRPVAVSKGTRQVTFVPRGGKVVLIAGNYGIVKQHVPDEVTLHYAADLVGARPR